MFLGLELSDHLTCFSFCTSLSVANHPSQRVVMCLGFSIILVASHQGSAADVFESEVAFAFRYFLKMFFLKRVFFLCFLLVLMY